MHPMYKCVHNHGLEGCKTAYLLRSPLHYRGWDAYLCVYQNHFSLLMSGYVSCIILVTSGSSYRTSQGLFPLWEPDFPPNCPGVCSGCSVCLRCRSPPLYHGMVLPPSLPDRCHSVCPQGVQNYGEESVGIEQGDGNSRRRADSASSVEEGDIQDPVELVRKMYIAHLAHNSREWDVNLASVCLCYKLQQLASSINPLYMYRLPMSIHCMCVHLLLIVI